MFKNKTDNKIVLLSCLIGSFASQVETIGDAYMVVGGVPERSADHAQRVARFAMSIVGQAALVPSPSTGMPLQVGQLSCLGDLEGSSASTFFFFFFFFFVRFHQSFAL